MSERVDYSREIRDTIVKSSLTGVAATVLAVTAFSPAGFGGFVGTSVASGLGLDHANRNSDDPYARLPPFPSPLTQTELTDIRGELARTAASLEITRAATQDKIEYMRNVAEQRGLSISIAQMHQAAPTRMATAALAAPTTVVAPVAAPAVVATNIPSAHRDGNLELAALLLAHESL